MILSVIIPVYNEEKTIGQVIDKVLSACLPEGFFREIIVVDDGSIDGTVTALMQYRDHPSVQVYYSQQNNGKTAALVYGIKKAKGDYLVVQDADLEYNPDEYWKLLGPLLKEEADAVYGSRFLGSIKNMKWINRFANNFSNMTLRALYGVNLTDVNTCYKVFKREVIKDMNITSSGFAFETEVTVKLLKKRYKIVEVPIAYTARSRREGKKIRWASALAMYWGIIQYSMQKDDA